MIVCCPACQTRFNVDPALLGPDGRKVRCAKCAHVWRVGQDGLPVATGQFGLRPPQTRAPESSTAAQDEPQAAADIPPAPAAQGEAESANTPASAPVAEETSLWARELIERENQSKQAAGPAASAAEESQRDEATGAANMEHPAGATAAAGDATEAAPGPEASQRAPVDAAAKQTAHKARGKKGGQTFKMFLLVLCLVVLALFAIAALTGKFGPGGVAPDSRTPTIGDVTPPAPASGTTDSKPGQAEGGGGATGGTR